MKRVMVAGFSMLVAQSAAAQDADWAYKATFYGWLPSMSTKVDTLKFGTIESSASGGDILSDLNMVFMGTFAAQRGQWGFVGDLLYVNLSDSKDTPLSLYGEGTVKVSTTALSGYALYRVSTDPAVKFDVGGGFRAFDLDVDVTLSPGVLAGASESISKSWIDPLIAARLEVPISERAFLTGFADWGGTGDGNMTWQVYGAIGYAFDEKWSTQFGYRYMDISKEVDGRDVSVDLGGPVISLTYAF